MKIDQDLYLENFKILFLLKDVEKSFRFLFFSGMSGMRTPQYMIRPNRGTDGNIIFFKEYC